MNEIAERLRTLRGNISQQQFGNLIGMPQRKLSRIETGSAPLDIISTQNICKILNVSADWLLLGRGSAPVTVEDMSQVSEPSPPPQNEEKRLTDLENERRELSTENRQLYREKTELLKEIADLRERLARLEEQAKTSNDDLKQGFTNPTAPASVPSVRSIAHTSD